MKTSRIILGGLAGAFAIFVVGWIVYGMILSDYTKTAYNQCASRPDGEMVWWALIGFNLAIGFLIAFVFSIANIKTILSGAITAGIIGFFSALAMDLSTYSMTTVFNSLTPLLIDVVVSTCMWAIAGLSVAMVMGFGNKEAKA